LTHTAGFVEDNPWGDRQQVMSEAEFDKLLTAGVAFARPPGMAMEYSNLGYALLGRIITNISGKPYQDYIRGQIMQPLGMNSTTYDIFTSPQGRRAMGYRWQDNQWVKEPDMKDGVFGAMGGVETSANDYAHWVTFLCRRGRRAMASKAALFAARRCVKSPRGAISPPAPCAPHRWADRPVVRRWPMRWRGGRLTIAIWARSDAHGRLSRLWLGGGPAAQQRHRHLCLCEPHLWRAQPAREPRADGFAKAGAVKNVSVTINADLASAYEAAKAVWRTGDINAAPLANNMLLDRDAERWRKQVEGLKAEVGACAATEALQPISAMEGRFAWTCEHGRVAGRVQRSPKATVEIQALNFSAAEP
jgi:hypothetical protein